MRFNSETYASSFHRAYDGVGGALDDPVVGVDDAEEAQRSTAAARRGGRRRRTSRVVGLQHVLERDVGRRPRERSHHLLRDLAVAVLDGESCRACSVGAAAPPITKSSRVEHRRAGGAPGAPSERSRPCGGNRLPPPPRLKLGLPRREHEREHVVRRQRLPTAPPSSSPSSSSSDDARGRGTATTAARDRGSAAGRSSRGGGGGRCRWRRRRRAASSGGGASSSAPPSAQKRSQEYRAAQCASANFARTTAHSRVCTVRRASRGGGGGDGDDRGDGGLGAAAARRRQRPARRRRWRALPGRQGRLLRSAPLSAASSGSVKRHASSRLVCRNSRATPSRSAGQDEAGDRPEAHGARKPHVCSPLAQLDVCLAPRLACCMPARNSLRDTESPPVSMIKSMRRRLVLTQPCSRFARFHLPALQRNPPLPVQAGTSSRGGRTARVGRVGGGRGEFKAPGALVLSCPSGNSYSHT